MLIPIIASIMLVLATLTSATLLSRDVMTRRMRERIGAVRSRPQDAAPATPVRLPARRAADQRGKLTAQIVRMLHLNPEIPEQNVIAWKLVIAIACGLAAIGFFYGRAFLGWPLAALLLPVEAFFVARFIFGWERTRYQRAVLEQIPEVMAQICRAVSAGVPLTEGLRAVAREAATPSREAFMLVVSEVAIGQPLERALWKLHERTGLAEYAFFAVTIGLQAQTGGSLVETLQNLQDLVRKRVTVSRRGKALAAEVRMSATIMESLPFVAGIALIFIRPGFLDFFLNTPAGNHLLLAAFGLLGAGMLTMRYLIRMSLAP